MLIHIRRCSLRSILLALLGAIVLFSFMVREAVAQNPPGIQMFSTNENGVDLATGNINIDNIQFRIKVGKIPFWSHISGTSGITTQSPYLNPMLSFYIQTPATAQFASTVVQGPTLCEVGSTKYYTEVMGDPSFVDSTGAPHAFGGSASIKWTVGSGPAGSACANSGSGSWAAIDASGYTLLITNGNPTIYDRGGNYWTGSCTYAAGCQLTVVVSGESTTVFTDPDGATISSGLNSSGVLQETDSLNTTVFTNVPNANVVPEPAQTTSSVPLSYLDVATILRVTPSMVRART